MAIINHIEAMKIIMEMPKSFVEPKVTSYLCQHAIREMLPGAGGRAVA